MQTSPSWSGDRAVLNFKNPVTEIKKVKQAAKNPATEVKKVKQAATREEKEKSK